jgi:thiol:disulfide interchange protein/DsbC/DsbD-like thiol-disulfide interchange protein
MTPGHLAALLLAALLPASPAWGGAEVRTDNVTARLVVERDRISPGETLDLALVLDIRPGWHTYWKNPGDSGEPPRLDWDLPAGVDAGPIRWPYPSLIRVGPLANYGYSGRATHLVALSLPADWPPGKPLSLRVRADWLVCEQHCIPEGGNLELTLGVVPAEAAARDPGAGSPETTEARAKLPEAPIVGAKLTRTGGGMRLQIPAAVLPGRPDSVWFFPDQWGLIDHAAPQPWRQDGGDLVLDLTPGAAPQVTHSGVLVVGSGGTTRGYPVTADLASDLAPELAPGGAAAPIAPDGEDLGFAMALVFALAGGLILNLMPCVFPILAMKALGLAGQGGASRRHRILHALAYAGGVLTFFVLIAALLLGLRAGGQAVGWGFQLQYPPFVALMAYLFVVLGLSLAGAMTLGARLMGIAAGRPTSGAGGAFATGALAALVAAPCTAPFMGAALGYATTLVWPAALAVILTLGLGLALPFVVLSVSPTLARRLPKPGPWMGGLKQFLAFPMFATAAWLVWVLSVQVGPPGVAAVLAGLVLLALGLWAWERTRNHSGRWRLPGLVVAWAGLGLALYLGLTMPTTRPQAGSESGGRSAVLPAESFSPDRLAEALGDGRPVLVNMTAAWCITCLVNERVALERPAVAEAMARRGALYLKGDWTRRDPAITAYLAEFERNGVPLYVWYPRAAEPRVLPQILTEGILLDALEGPSRPGS